MARWRWERSERMEREHPTAMIRDRERRRRLWTAVIGLRSLEGRGERDERERRKVRER